VTVRGVDNIEATDVEPVRLSGGSNLSGGPYEDRDNDARFRCLRCAPQRRLIAGMGDDGRHRWKLFCAGDQPVEAHAHRPSRSPRHSYL